MKISIPKPLGLFVTWMFTFIAISSFFYIMGAYNFCYLEQWQTFVYDSSYTTHTLKQPGGFVQLMAGFLIQFFHASIAGILITAFLLSAIFLLMAHILKRWTGNNLLWPSVLLPVVALVFMHFNTNYLYEGTLAFLLMLVGLTFHLCIRSTISRFIYSLCYTVFLFATAGSIATLYVILLIIMEVFISPKKSVVYLFLILVVYLLAQYVLWEGWFGEWKHTLLADAYFTRRLPAGSAIHLPWGISIGLFLVGGLFRYLPNKPNLNRIWLITQGIVVGIFLYQGAPQYISKDNETFKELTCLIDNGQWDAIIDRCKEIPMTNLLHQNCLNLAFAEKGCLLQELKHYPNIGIQSLFIGGNKTPYISALLNDIYFSMGHISFSQRYAFEANESMGGFSPKLLKRLVQTSLVYGHYELAMKYIQILEKTLFYQEWAKAQRAFLHNDSLLEADPILGAKRKCIFPDNRFAGNMGLDKDLEEILKQNPSHHATEQYLKAIQKFIGTNIPRP